MLPCPAGTNRCVHGRQDSDSCALVQGQTPKIRTICGQGAFGAVGLPRNANEHGEVKDSVVVGAERTGWSQLVRKAMNPANASGLGAVRTALKAAQPARNVVVDNHRSPVAMERQPRGGGIRPDTGQGNENLRLFGDSSAELRRDDAGRSMKQWASPVEAQVSCQSGHCLGRLRCERGGRRVAFLECGECAFGLWGARAREHDFRNQGEPWIRLNAPAKLLEMRPTPFQETAAYSSDSSRSFISSWLG